MMPQVIVAGEIGVGERVVVSLTAKNAPQLIDIVHYWVPKSDDPQDTGHATIRDAQAYVSPPLVAPAKPRRLFVSVNPPDDGSCRSDLHVKWDSGEFKMPSVRFDTWFVFTVV